MTVGIIGLGRFGTLAAKIMSRYFDVVAYDIKPLKMPKRIKLVALEVAAAQDIVILAVPIREMKYVLKRISPFVKNGSLVCDVCSVKEKPVEWMKKYLPAYVSILGTHPLFGPDSVSKNFTGNEIIVTPVRVSKSKLFIIEKALKKAGLNVYKISPEEHDRAIATTQTLLHFIARGFLKLPEYKNIPETKSHKTVKGIFDTLNKDTIELFEDINRYNRFALKVRSKFIAELKELNSKVT